ncbi:MAG: HTTM domain-containing protein, partial [Myxococcales bacterium]|nr:HTTM domain-containing protein [Myxococcales bacterium]
VAVVFHVAVGLLFPIGVFPFVMLAAATVFFEPGWCRRGPAPTTPAPMPRWAPAFVGVWLAVQVALPLRFVAQPGPVNWTEVGFRFAWRVMLIDKVGRVTYRVAADDLARPVEVDPAETLTPLQARQMSTQPDLVAQYARHLAARFEAEGHRGVRVYADAFVAYNGRPSQRFVDPTADLAAASTEGTPAWILPLAHPWPARPPPF